MRIRQVEWIVLLGLAFLSVYSSAQQGSAVHPVLEDFPAQLPVAEHNIVVYKQPGRYGAWPANHGIWSWGNEILVGFEAGYFKQQQNRHSINWDLPAEHLLARSVDGGETWIVEKHPDLRPPNGMKVAGVLTEPGGKPAVDCPGGIDFLKPNFILTARMSDTDGGPSRFYYSMNRGRSWKGAYKIPDFPNFGQKGAAARTDYIVYGKHDLALFLSVPKRNGKEGRVMAVRTKDGARTWNFVSFIGPEPTGKDYAIMPSSVRLSATSVLTAIRHTHWIEVWRSDDDLKTWYFVSKPVPETGKGNPPSMIRLRDGRIAITYGYRAQPYGIHARLSSDDGQTWGPEIILRSNAGWWDIGYPRTVQRPDGKIVTVYYWDDAPDQERYIAATIWDPGPSSVSSK